MPKFMDYYAVLAVPSSASRDEIRSAYHKLALKYHPDHNPGDRAAEGRFKEINEAYAGLSSPRKRGTYDQLWENLRHGQDFVLRSVSGTVSRAASFSDLFHSLFGDMADGPPSCPGDTGFELHLSLAEALRGSRQALNVCCWSICPACSGSGLVKEALCVHCRGAGRLVEIKKVGINLPEGLRDGDRLRLNGLDRVLPAGLTEERYLKIYVAPHPDFKVAGDDLETELGVAASVADLAGEVPVPALDGVLGLKLPRNCRTGARLRVPGRGLRRKDGTRGDLCVVINIYGDSSSIPRQSRKGAGLWS